jgi:hypothetical protein
MATYHIKTEAEAWDMIEKVLAGGVSFPESPQFDFQGWPLLDVYLPSTPIQGSISPTMMAAFIELQKSINRTYLLVASNTADLRALSAGERERLEIRVKVEKGSSDYSIDLTKIFESIGAEAFGKMDSAHIAITVLGVALVIGGVVAFKSWLDSKAELRKVDADAEGQAALIELQKETLKAGTAHMRILADAIKQQPLLDDVEAATEPARAQLVKSLGEEGGGRAFGVSLSADAAREIGSQRRQQSETVKLAGNYRVIKVDTSSPDGFRVTLGDDTNGTEITATMQDALVSEAHKTAIQRAEWQKRPVYVELSAKKLRNRIVDALVLQASDPAPAQGRETK